MSDTEVIDLPVELDANKPFIEIIRWWEKKRVAYNITLILVELAMAIIIWNGTLRWGTITVLLGSFLFMALANIFYTMGWGIELLARYYFPTFKLNDQTRSMLFFIGLAISIFTTVICFYIWLDVQEI